MRTFGIKYFKMTIWLAKAEAKGKKNAGDLACIAGLSVFKRSNYDGCRRCRIYSPAQSRTSGYGNINIVFVVRTRHIAFKLVYINGAWRM